MSSWLDQFNARLPLLGHRNWVVVADAALPEQSVGGETLYADEPLDDVLRKVSEALNKAQHVRPVAWRDMEVNYLTDEETPGIDEVKSGTRAVLEGSEVRFEVHPTILKKLTEASQSYTILTIKTPTFLPYTSVFFELDCGYWTPKMESELRERMAK